jgi:cytochrome c oxidase subunit 2
MIKMNKMLSLFLFSLLFFVFFGFLSSIFSAETQNPREPAFSGELKNGVREIKVEAYKYGFFPDPIIAKLGEKVRLLVSAKDITHGILISEFKIKQVLPKGKTVTIEFIASKQGTFIVHCSVYCGPGHGQQKARLIVR